MARGRVDLVPAAHELPTAEVSTATPGRPGTDDCPTSSRAGRHPRSEFSTATSSASCRSETQSTQSARGGLMPIYASVLSVTAV